MKIFVTRHGQTKLNKASLMQGRVDEPLNETGINQAGEVHEKLKDVKFDAVYSSPLKRAVRTAAVIADINEDEIVKDERLLEFDFGPYDLKPYMGVGLKMTLYWTFPEVFKAPKDVETIEEAKSRVKAFLEELKTKDYDNVLIVCHGGIIRVICGQLEGRKSGLRWRPRPKNCEVREYEVD